LNGIELLDGFRRRVKWKGLMAFFPADRDDDFHHRRLVIDDHDFRHSQRREYFKFEKRKGESGKTNYAISPPIIIQNTSPLKLMIDSYALDASDVVGIAIMSA